MLIKKEYPNPLIDRVFKFEFFRLNCIKPYGPEKCLILLILLYAGVKLTQIDEKT